MGCPSWSQDRRVVNGEGVVRFAGYCSVASVQMSAGISLLVRQKCATEEISDRAAEMPLHRSSAVLLRVSQLGRFT